MNDLLEYKLKLLGSPLFFTQVFYKLRTGRDFEITEPIGRESHFITISKSLKKVFNGDVQKLIINIPPRYGKTEMLIHFVAWSMARHPDSNFIYVSYSHTLAKRQTQTIREIINLPFYKKMFGVEICPDSSAKDNFKTTQGGIVYGVGSEGAITGFGSGINNCERFGGCIVIDDIHKPNEVTSDTIRQSTNEWYFTTLQSRLNNPKTPIIYIGQRVHEDDLAANLIKTNEWGKIIIPSIDAVGNALNPKMHSKEVLLKMKEQNPYVFSAQYQQDPQPSGGGIFKPEWFYLMDEEPEVLTTFITADTAETDKDYNDATVFSFWGIHKIKHGNDDTDILGLHWIDCVELRVEPKDLQKEFMQFYSNCMRYKVKPSLIAIEKKSTGTTLLSVLSNYQGLQLHNIDRTKASRNKTDRYLEIQQYLASKRVSLPRYSNHTNMCIEHCRKITANASHRFDDIADTLYDAVKIGLIENYLFSNFIHQDTSDQIVKQLAANLHRRQQIRGEALWQR